MIVLYNLYVVFFAMYFSPLFALQASQMQNELVASVSIHVLAVQCPFLTNVQLFAINSYGIRIVIIIYNLKKKKKKSLASENCDCRLARQGALWLALTPHVTSRCGLLLRCGSVSEGSREDESVSAVNSRKGTQLRIILTPDSRGCLSQRPCSVSFSFLFSFFFNHRRVVLSRRQRPNRWDFPINSKFPRWTSERRSENFV